MENNELNLEELEDVSGGKLHFKPAKDRKGFIQHKVLPGETLIRIAQKYGIPSYKKILEWNPHIDPKTNLIRDGEYLWIKM